MRWESTVNVTSATRLDRPQQPSPRFAVETARKVCVAPMMGCTDRHNRYLLRLISKHALLYTEMITTGTLMFGDHERMLAFDHQEHPVALQIGGSDPSVMARCARLGETFGYDEINMNVGCPSDRVQSGAFGACLMAAPQQVADCVSAMKAVTSIPITVKTRIGIDNQDSFEQLCEFIGTVAQGGCDTFIMHARKAWLNGLSPRQNRTIPPLDYPRVYKLKTRFPHLTIIINGGVTDLGQISSHLKYVDGAMIGRAAYANPFMLAEVDQRYFEAAAVSLSRHEVLTAFTEYCEQQLAAGCRISRLIKHITGLFQGQPGARKWRRHLSDNMHRPDAGTDVIRKAASFVT